jgi:hypothetical protein
LRYIFLFTLLFYVGYVLNKSIDQREKDDGKLQKVVNDFYFTLNLLGFKFDLPTHNLEVKLLLRYEKLQQQKGINSADYKKFLNSKYFSEFYSLLGKLDAFVKENKKTKGFENSPQIVISEDENRLRKLEAAIKEIKRIASDLEIGEGLALREFLNKKEEVEQTQAQILQLSKT